MADLSFQNAKVLGVSQSSNFIGGDVFRLSTTQTIEIEGFIKNPNSDWGTVTQEDGVGVGNPPSNFDNIQAEMVSMKGKFLADEGFSLVELNGISIGQGKVISLDFPSSVDIREDSITFGKYIASIEIYAAASSVNTKYTNDINIYDESTVNKINLYAVNIEDFSESFDFNIAEDDAYNYSHEISIKLRKISDTSTPAFDSKTIAQEIANAILELSKTLNAKLGYIDNRYKEYLRKIEGTANYSENYDEFQHEYTFSKNLSILSRYTETEFYSAKITHAIAVNNFGIINITESGEIKGMKNNSGKYANAKTGITAEIGNSSERCNTIYTDYKTGLLSDQKYGEESLAPASLSSVDEDNDTLKRAIRISKRFNSFSGTASYDAEYTDDPKIGTLSSHQYTIELAKDSNNITTITQRGTIIPYEDKRPDFTRLNTVDSKPNPILGSNSIYKQITKLSDTPETGELLHSSGEINTLYKEVEANKLLYKYQMTSSSVTFPKFGVTISYSRAFSDDTAILDPTVNDGIKRLSLDYDNSAPIRMKSNHLVPNMKENVTDSDQISVGERSVAISAVVERDFTKTNKIGKETQDGNNGDDAITFQRDKLNTGLTKVIKEAKLNVLFLNSTNMPAESYDIYPTACSYSINSSNQIDFRLSAGYIFKDGRHFNDLDSFFIEEVNT